MAEMSAVNVELARRGYEAVARGDLDVIRDLLDADVKWHGGDESAVGACHNREEVLAFMGAAIDRGGVGKLAEIIDAGTRVVVVLQPPTSEGLTAPLRANLTTFRDGKVVEMIAYDSPQAALAAAGIERH
jgi:ketosteroid isomerase-like protein